MPSVVAFHYELATYVRSLLFYHHFHVHYCYMSTTVICICHVERLEVTSQLKHAAHLCGHKKLRKLDDRKNLSKLTVHYLKTGAYKLNYGNNHYN